MEIFLTLSAASVSAGFTWPPLTCCTLPLSAMTLKACAALCRTCAENSSESGVCEFIPHRTNINNNVVTNSAAVALQIFKFDNRALMFVAMFQI